MTLFSILVFYKLLTNYLSHFWVFSVLKDHRGFYKSCPGWWLRKSYWFCLAEASQAEQTRRDLEGHVNTIPEDRYSPNASREPGLPRMPGWTDSLGSCLIVLGRISKILLCPLKPVITKTGFYTCVSLLLVFTGCSFLRRLSSWAPILHQGLWPVHAS